VVSRRRINRGQSSSLIPKIHSGRSSRLTITRGRSPRRSTQIGVTRRRTSRGHHSKSHPNGRRPARSLHTVTERSRSTLDLNIHLESQVGTSANGPLTRAAPDDDSLHRTHTHYSSLDFERQEPSLTSESAYSGQLIRGKLVSTNKGHAQPTHHLETKGSGHLWQHNT
jgi:hypothetical protein